MKFLESGPRGQAGELSAAASYRTLDDRNLADSQKVRARVDAQGFDGLVMLSFVSEEKQVTMQPPSYGTLWVRDPSAQRRVTV